MPLHVCGQRPTLLCIIDLRAVFFTRRRLMNPRAAKTEGYIVSSWPLPAEKGLMTAGCLMTVLFSDFMAGEAPPAGTPALEESARSSPTIAHLAASVSPLSVAIASL